MGRAPCCSKVGLHRGPWTAQEDEMLIKHIQTHGEGQWRSLPKRAGLLRCGKSCRLRWVNYLRPDIKRGNISPDEEDLIIKLHALLGNRWSMIAGRLPGRTDNEIKNYWNSHIRKKLRCQGSNKSSKINSSSKNRRQIKIYRPKPTRLKSSFKPKKVDTIGTGPSKKEEAQEHVLLGINTVFPNQGKGDDLPTVEVLDNLTVHNDDDFDCLWHFQVPIKDGMFEKVYEEFSQLLQEA